LRDRENALTWRPQVADLTSGLGPVLPHGCSSRLSFWACEARPPGPS
jgi:hypothetical protein